MKKAIVAIAALFLAISAHAQFGIMGGLTSSSGNIESAIANAKGISQYHVGITYKLGIGNLLAIQPALLYNVKGTSIGAAADNLEAFDVNFKTGFIEIPVQVQVGFGIGSLARVYGFAEPFVGYAVSNKIEGNWIEDFNDNWQYVKSRLEYGIGLGAGVELFRHLQVSVKYFWNLGDVYGLTFENVSNTVLTSKCSGVAASVAFLF